MAGIHQVKRHGTTEPGTWEIEKDRQKNGYSRFKELDCLYHISKRMAATHSDKIFQMMVNELREALRYPKVASARMAIGEKEFKTKVYQENGCKQSTDIAMHGQKIGSIEVNYSSQVKHSDKEPFTESEKLLLNIAAQLAWVINENHLIEDNLRKSTSRLQTILENLPDNIYEVDTNLTVLWTNKSPQDVGRTCYAIHFNRSKPCEGCPVLKAISTGQKQVGIMRHMIKGENIYWEDTGVPVKSKDGNVVGAIAVARNITERLRAEEGLQAANHLALIGQLASGIAHEINNPLSGVTAFSDLLMRQHVSDETKEAVQVIYEGAQRVSEIVRRLLEFARPQRRCQKPVDINAALQSALDLQRYSLATDNITVITELDLELPKTMADEGQIQEVFHNLIANARAEMKIAHNKGNLFIETQVVDDSIRISFKDDGPGIPRDHMNKLFTPFFTTRPVGEGTGLGLSICHTIVAEHNGRIYADSQPDKGATFIVELPVIECESQFKIVQEDPSKSTAPTQLRILVIDDEPIVQRSLGNVLITSGHNVETVGAADEALDRLNAGDYDLILLDVKLPGLSGIELYKVLEKTRPSLSRRIVFITGDVIGQDTFDFFSCSKVPYLLKPIHLEDLEKVISDVYKINGIRPLLSL